MASEKRRVIRQFSDSISILTALIPLSSVFRSALFNLFTFPRLFAGVLLPHYFRSDGSIPAVLRPPVSVARSVQYGTRRYIEPMSGGRGP